MFGPGEHPLANDLYGAHPGKEKPTVGQVTAVTAAA